MEGYPHFNLKQKKFIRLQRNYIQNKKKTISTGEIQIEPEGFIRKIGKPLALSSTEEFWGFIHTLGAYNKELSLYTEEPNARDEIGKDLLRAVVAFWLKFLMKKDEPDYFYCVSVEKKGKRKYVVVIV